MGWTHRLFGLCDHKWVEEKREDLMAVSVVNPSSQRNVGEAVFCHCEKCGLPRLFRLKV